VTRWPQSQAWLKLENEQVTGSFKARGGGHKLASLSAEARALGVVTASSGNHGAGVAHAGAAMGCPVMVFVPEGADASKVARIRALGADVQTHGTDCVQTEAHARAWAAQHGRIYVSPYNDLEVVAGQGTIGLELLEQVPDLARVYIAVGGGGLISGVGSYLKTVRPDIEVVACSPARSPAMHECLEAGHIIDVPCDDTLSDATAGGVEPDAVTFGLCQAVIDRSELVSEQEIADAMRAIHQTLGIGIEGAAGVAMATYLREQSRHKDEPCAVIICGGNIAPETLQRVLNNASPTDHRTG
jgi:threonine dehydratase